MSPKPTSYKIRNKFHVVEGTLSKRDILKRIRAGQLTGEEEIAPPPHTRWQKLASHPDFYDAFLKRLYDKDYKAPDQDPESDESIQSRQGHSNVDRATRQAEPGKTRAFKDSEKEDHAKTRQIGEDRIKEYGATIHQSVIDELFKDGSSPRRPQGELEADLPPSQGTDLIQIDSPTPESTLPADIEQTRRLEFSADPPHETPREAEIKPRRGPRKLVTAVALIAMLVLLFRMGKEDGPLKEKGDITDRNQLLATSRQLIATGESKEDRVKSLVEEADALAATDTPLAYSAALEIYRTAAAIDSSAPVIGRLAQTAARVLPGNPNAETLITEINQLIQQGRGSDPHFSQFYRVEALVAMAQNKLEDARRLMLNASEADPINPENLLVTAEVLYAAQELPSAKAAVDDSLKTFPASVRAHALMAQIALDQRDMPRARAEALEALKLNPLHPLAYLLLADAVSLQNQTKEARGLYETCGRLAKFASPEITGKAYLRLGVLQEGGESADSAQRNFLLAYHYAPQLEGVAEKVSKLEVDAEALRLAAQEMEYDKTYFQLQAEGLMKQKKFTEAVKFFQAARLTDPKDGTALIHLGEVTERTAGSYDDFRRVMNLYQRAIEIDPTQALGYIKLGMLETEQYNLERAYKLLTQAVALAPNDAAPYVALGKHYYKRQDYTEALNQFLKAAKINPSDSEISYHAGLLRLLYKKEGARDALRFFYQAYTLDSTNYDALAEWLKLKVLNYEKNFAIKFVRNLIDADPQNASLHWALGEVYATNKEYRRAISFYHQSLDYENKTSKVRMSLARALEAIGELDKAVAEYRLASLLDRRNSDGFYRAADLQFQMKKYNEAEEVLKFLVSITPNYPGAHRYLSKVYQVRKQKDAAIDMMKKEVANNPQNAKFRIEMAELYMEYEKYDLAVIELTEVTNLPSITKSPEFVYDKIRGYLLLSRCYRAQNKPESAEGAIKLALDIDSTDPQLHKELGFVYYSLQRDKEGVKAFETYIQRNPAAPDAPAIKGLIQQMMIEE